MDKLHKILYIINNNQNVNQRDLSSISGLSIGGVNSIIKELQELEYINIDKQKRKSIYILTKKGINSLAVAFLDIKDKKIIDRFIDILSDNGIEKVVIVTGYQSSYYEEYAKNNNKITLIKNDKYKWSGTMTSLSLVKDIIDDDFLLLENDMIFEERAIKEILKSKDRDCMLITSESGSGDEALVEIRDGYIYKMSKDVHQFNKIDGEMIGISKISYEVFEKMLEQFKHNKNPYLNYEYMLMDIGREFKIGYKKIDDLVWSEIDSMVHYERFIKKIYSKLLRKEQEIKINNIKEKLVNILDVDESEIEEVALAGGMTNKNYKVKISGKDYILRIPGNGTESMISRINEKHNSKLANELGIDTHILYFDEVSGIKISELIEDAETINSQTAKREDIMESTTSILRKLHNSGLKFNNTFDVFKEIVKYEQLLKEANGNNFKDYLDIRTKVMSLENKLEKLGREIKPCHNDTVAENFIKGKNDKLYLIDWEYSGSNDPMWDLAAHIIECDFNTDEEELFIQKYFETNKVEEKYKTKILIYKICQDFLWSLWTNIKEAKGDDFGTYGIDRYNRAKENLNLLGE